MEEIFEICVWIAQIWIDIHRIIWAKIEESQTGSQFKAISVNIQKNPYTNFICVSVNHIIIMVSIIAEYYFYVTFTHKNVITLSL